METKWIWPFELLEKLGEGGMGVVYRARYVGDNRQVAVKLIPDDTSINATLLARFERELEVLKQLRHPNIVHCFGGRCESKQRYYAMEYIPGGTLADYLAERGRLPWETVVDFGIQMCAALQHAHEHGVIHRDVKPGNFLVTKVGQLKLSDFGIASVVAEGRLTAAGRTVGTILYMSPEQIRGGQLTHRADLYSLGCVMYEMLSGHTPFEGSSPAEVLQRHLKEPPPHVARLLPECPLELDALIYELLNKDPEQRPPTAEEVSSRLHGIILPSRRRDAAEPNFIGSLSSMAETKNVVVSPLRQIPLRDSEAAIPQLRRKRKVGNYVPWLITALSSICCFQLWVGWAQSAQELHRMELTWVNLLETADPPTKIIAARALSNFNHLSPTAIGKLSSAANSQPLELKLAALKALQQHAAESRAVAAELVRIQKVDENSFVRTAAGLAVESIQRATGPSSILNYLSWLIVPAILAGLCAFGWRIWKHVEPIAR